MTHIFFKCPGRGVSLFNANGPAWSRLRRATVPAFSQQNLRNKAAPIISEIKDFVDRLVAKSATGEVMDMKYEVFDSFFPPFLHRHHFFPWI